MIKKKDSLLYPLQHVSIRVPWHDNGWTGSVCKNPGLNTACLKLKGIADSKNDDEEEGLREQSIDDLIEKGLRLPPCIKERATFMADFAFSRTAEHPYSRTSPETHGHFRPTELRHTAYSAAAVPFLWMMKDQVWGDSKQKLIGMVRKYPLEDVSQDHEPELGFETNWVQDYSNHTALLDCFWKHVRLEESLVFFYAKQVPLVEDTGRRVLIGVGRVKKLGPLTEYNYDGSPDAKLRSMLWERMVTHSIRPDFADGFLMPYQEALEKSDEGRAFDPAEVVAFAPEDRFQEFSFATEHVGNDAAISALLSLRDALHRCSESFGYNAAAHERWIDKELGRLWRKRGPFPGLGPVLCAMGVELGNFIAQHLVDKVGDAGNPWPAWFELLDAPAKQLPAELARHIDKTIASSWKKMSGKRRAFLELLSRFALTQDQAAVLATDEGRKGTGINLSDEEIVANPYLVYETTRLTQNAVSVGIVDRGMFPTALIRENFPISEPSLVQTPVDARRLRALTIRLLEKVTADGHTLLSRERVVSELRRWDENRNDEIPAQITADLMAVAEEEVFDRHIRIVSMADESPAYQLERLAAAGELIRRTIEKRIDAKRHASKVDWRQQLDAFLLANKAPLPDDPVERDVEDRARQEKTAALEELAASRFSVLIGRAGTGKTTLLSVLCAQPQINEAGVLLLAPTGKARVRMEDIARRAGITNSRAMTLAQHLSDSGRYEGGSQRYLLTGKSGTVTEGTVIVDECSMLTEEMLAALIESLRKVDRLILVGDYRQLPPIGAGRPFIDIVSLLQPEAFEDAKPHVARGFAELMIPRRQGTAERDDLLLASWFGGNETSAGDDEVFQILSGKRTSETVRFESWETPDELQRLIPQNLRETLGDADGLEDWQALCKWLGGNQDSNGSFWFNNNWGEHEGSGIAAEAWQILSPVRQKPWGVDALNRFIHNHYKARQIEQARNPGQYRSIPSPKSDQQIIYGDKVINNRNWRVSMKRMFPTPNAAGYLANGEIGVVVGHRRTKKKSWTPKDLEIEFSTQRGTVFKFYNSDFKDEGDSGLELAYALTVHKAQGSEFKTVFLILPRSPLMVTRELLYTALTRQKEKVVVLLQGSATDLHRFSSAVYSAAASRLTNLFRPPKPVSIKGQFLEERLIHNTTIGVPVRSKSEVIIANLLHSKGIEFLYEEQLKVNGQLVDKFPDFTIYDDNTGITHLWEHLGMLNDPGYKRRWEEKQQWYFDNGIRMWNDNEKSDIRLITTRDDSRGGIDAAAINRLAEEVFF